LERSEFIRRKRRAIEERKLAEERKVIAQAEARRRQEELEADARAGRGRVALKDALRAYEQAMAQLHGLESSLGEARAQESFLRTDADPSSDKFAKSLASARDVTLAGEIRVERALPILQQAGETLSKAIAAARAEYAFLHHEERQGRIARSLEHFDNLFDKETFSRRLRITFLNLAETTHEVVALDRAVSYANYWTRLDQPVPTSKQLLQGASEVEARFVSLDQVTSPK
jgi:hypothetical protein